MKFKLKTCKELYYRHEFDVNKPLLDKYNIPYSLDRLDDERECIFCEFDSFGGIKINSITDLMGLSADWNSKLIIDFKDKVIKIYNDYNE